MGLNLVGQAILGSEFQYVDNARFWRNAYDVTAYGSVAVVEGWAFGGRLLTGLGNAGRPIWSMGGNAWAGAQNLGRSAISKFYMNPRWFVLGEEAIRTTAEVATGADLGPSANDFVTPLARTGRNAAGDVILLCHLAWHRSRFRPRNGRWLTFFCSLIRPIPSLMTGVDLP